MKAFIRHDSTETWRCSYDTIALKLTWKRSHDMTAHLRSKFLSSELPSSKKRKKWLLPCCFLVHSSAYFHDHTLPDLGQLSCCILYLLFVIWPLCAINYKLRIHKYYTIFYDIATLTVHRTHCHLRVSAFARVHKTTLQSRKANSFQPSWDKLYHNLLPT